MRSLELICASESFDFCVANRRRLSRVQQVCIGGLDLISVQRRITIGGHDAGFRDFRDFDVEQVMGTDPAKRSGTSIGEAVLELKAKNSILYLSVAGALGGVAMKSVTRTLKAKTIASVLTPDGDRD
jgi:hypothetical protein